MSIGSTIRRMFGPHERQVAEVYRSIYVDLDALARQLRDWIPAAPRILEVGCGEGALTERLQALFPNAEIVGIDIASNVGRLFAGDSSRVSFRQALVGDIARSEPESFDLVVMCDVLHHVPLDLRAALLADIRRTIRPGGRFVLKDWARNATPIHWLCYASDRFITGDRIAYATPLEVKSLLSQTFGADQVRDFARIRPWRNNISFLVHA